MCLVHIYGLNERSFHVIHSQFDSFCNTYHFPIVYILTSIYGAAISISRHQVSHFDPQQAYVCWPKIFSAQVTFSGKGGENILFGGWKFRCLGTNLGGAQLFFFHDETQNFQFLSSGCGAEGSAQSDVVTRFFLLNQFASELRIQNQNQLHRPVGSFPCSIVVL